MGKTVFGHGWGVYKDGIVDWFCAGRVTGIRGLQNGGKGSVRGLVLFRGDL